MSDIPSFIPEGYEIIRTVVETGSTSEYIARRTADDTPVRLKIFNFSRTSGATTRRHLREYLRCDITFMEELEVPGIMRVLDYSDRKDLLWVATQPAEVDKLSECFGLLASRPFKFRQTLIQHFLANLQRIHSRRVVHRNLSGDALFLSSEGQIYIGDFGFAGYLSDRPTIRPETISVTTIGYLPPEVRDAKTFSCDFSCDIFSAGLLVFEILSATSLPKDNAGQIHEVLCRGLKEQVMQEIITADAAEVILKAADPAPEKRWPSAEAFAGALKKSLQVESARGPASVREAPTVAVTKPAEQSKTLSVQPTAAPRPSMPAKKTPAPSDAIVPLDPSHEIWNNHYEIIEKIGEGGQAVVYKAYDHLTNEEVAIKTIWSHHRADRDAINRLKQGAMIARSLTHRYIIKTYSVEQRIDADSPGGYVFICMELIKSRLELGDIIEKRFASGQKVRLDETLHIIRQLLDALSYAHEYTIHRDIKPGNIMLVPRGEQTEIDPDSIGDLTKFDIRLIDFGIAKVLSQKHIDVTGKGFRSAHYGAPELGDSRTAVDARADIYSAGVIMYQMLTNTIPRKGSPPAHKVNKKVPAALGKVIDKAITADRAKRFKSISDFSKEIDKAVSKFNWLRKTAKAAAVLVFGACIAAGVNYLLPEPNYGSVEQSIEILETREPEKKIAELADEIPVKYSDIAGFNSYDKFRKTALDNLKVVRMAGNDRFNKDSFSPWKDQEELWVEIEPAVEKIEHIAEDQREYKARKNLAVAEHLMKLEPSSEIVSEVTENAEKAESLLGTRPIAPDILDTCADSYDLGARVYKNIDNLADGSDAPDTAEQINDKLKDVEKLRTDFLFTRDSLDKITQLKESDFYERSEKCFGKANRSYRSFELGSAGKYFGLMNQICRTMMHVRDEIDFKRSDIGLIGSRLMQLCYEDIDTFEDYPSWKEKLEQVYEKKDVLARCKLLQILLSGSPEDVSLDVYELTSSAIDQYKQSNFIAANDKLADAVEKYKKFMRQRIDGSISDCDFLLTFSSVAVQNMKDCQKGLENLSSSIDGQAWPQEDFAEQFNGYAEEITKEKDSIRTNLIQKARKLKKEILESSAKIQQQDYFWNSQQIDRYAAVAQNYNENDIDTSIENWKYVDNLPRISAIVNQMENIDSYLDKMLARKDQLDRLSKDIDRGINFCQKFKGTSDTERKKYKKFESELTQLRAELTARWNGTYLIDLSDEIYDSEYEKIYSPFMEIRAQLPFHRTRVIEMINKTRSLEETADYLGECSRLWAELVGQLDLSLVKPNFRDTRDYLESVKEDVDKWTVESFNEKMQDSCKKLARVLDNQSKAVTIIADAIIDEKSGLVESLESYKTRVNEILDDEDIRTLDNIATNDRSDKLVEFRQLPVTLETSKNTISDIVLSGEEVPGRITTELAGGFEVDIWIEKFNAKNDLFNNRISQLKAAENVLPTFQQARQMLTRQSSMEKNYYLGLRDYTLGLIDHSGLSGRIEAVETDRVAAGMCLFLERMGSDALPNLTDLKASVAAVGVELGELKSLQINNLKEAKGFNKKREKLLGRVETVRKDVDKLSIPNLEKSCKESVTEGVKELANLIKRSRQTDTSDKLIRALWALYPDHTQWRQWDSFLELHHIVFSNGGVRLISSDLLMPASEKGDYLDLTEIAEDPTKVFHTDTSDSASFGWPRYVTHQKDQTVILAFIPGTQSSGTEPFYMAARETSNAQYKLFMEKAGAKSTTNLKGWAYFSDRSNNLLIGQAQGQFPPSRITWDKAAGVFVIDEEFEYAPVTWVTSHGGQAYARWMSGQLPTLSQHVYAARAGNRTLYPWGDKPSSAASYAHLRNSAWQKAAREYNVQRDNPVEIAYPPVGAVKDFLTDKGLDPAKIVYEGGSDETVWPCFTKDKKPNSWGLYDMVGNVWEWCADVENNSQMVACGGSCLSPPEYARPEATYQLENQASDVGFRILIPVR